MMSRLVTVLVAFLLFGGISYGAQSDVPAGLMIDPKNGNFSLREEDVRWGRTGWDLSLYRTLNSVTGFPGLFGQGWCSDFETSVTELPEGNVLYTICGAGRSVTYGSLGKTDARIQSVVRDIVERLHKGGKIKSEAERGQLEVKLRTDPMERRRVAIELKLEFPAERGVRMYEFGRGPAYIVRTDSGLFRHVNGQDVSEFDSLGRLRQRRDENGNELQFVYNGERLVQVLAGPDASMAVVQDGSGRITKLTGPFGTNEYLYSGALLTRVNTPKSTTTYQYSKEGHLAAVQRSDKKNISLHIDNRTRLLQKIVYPNSCHDSLTYPANTDKAGSYKVSKSSECPGQPPKTTTYEYWVGLNEATTARILLRSRVTSDDESVDVHYHRVFQKPIEIKGNRIASTYTYDSKGNVREVKLSDDLLKIEYDGTCGKINRITKKQNEHRFFYDGKCNVTAAESGDQRVSLRYDAKGRIIAVVDTKSGKAVLITPDAKLGKPTLIEAVGVGKLSITYGPEGELQKVDSPSGPSVAIQVSSIFNNLLDLVNPATQDLPGLQFSELDKNCSCSRESFMEFSK